jgi:hypothetical protein
MFSYYSSQELMHFAALEALIISVFMNSELRLFGANPWMPIFGHALGDRVTRWGECKLPVGR